MAKGGRDGRRGDDQPPRQSGGCHAEEIGRHIDRRVRCGVPAETRKVLEEVRSLIKSAARGATERMSYSIPTFDLNGKHLVHFAGYENHVGFYPTPSGIAAFEDELRPYKTAKGSVQFPLDRPIPADLIRRIVEFRVEALAS
jgi:uncharacterized protein YdhG (YjbR/CyaY superfamily)